MEHFSSAWEDALVFLVVAGIVVPALHRCRVAPVLGYLLAGALVGPFGMGLFVDEWPWLTHIVIGDSGELHGIAELGVIFLLFMIGLDLSLDRLWTLRRWVFGLGSLQVVVTAMLIGVIAWQFGNSGEASVILGACLALSSTAIVMQLLMERQQVGSALGQTSFAVLLFQDLAVVPILFMVGVMSAPGGEDVGRQLAWSLMQAALVVMAIYLVGRRVVRPLFRLVTLSRNIEMFTALALLVILVASAVTGSFGLSMALGAFLAGLLLAETEFRHEIEVTIEPFKGLLLGVFFMSVGMGIDIRAIAHEAAWILASVAGLFMLKAGVFFALARVFGLQAPIAFEAGLLLGQGGEFAFVVVGLAMTAGILPPATGQFMLIVTGLSMMVTPLVASLSQRLAVAWQARREANGQPEMAVGDIGGHVIIAGFGRVGRTLVHLLDAEAMPWVAIDRHATEVARHHRSGKPVYYGDAARVELLKRLHMERARALVITMDNAAATERVVQSVRAHWPHVPIIARARDAGHAVRLLQDGATDVVPETLEASLQMGARVLMAIGVSDEVARQHIERERDWQLDVMRVKADENAQDFFS